MELSFLDTDTLSLLQKSHFPLVQRVLTVPRDKLAITVISVEEQLTGWQASLRRAKDDSALELAYQSIADNVRDLSGWQIISFTKPAIRRYKALLAMKLNVGGMDLRIAAIALEENATVITMNLRDFQRVPGLKCENWAD